jgi:hypothetical protein
MNDLEFKRHLKDLAHGHHHPEEHDWGRQPPPKTAARVKSANGKRQASRKASRNK